MTDLERMLYTELKGYNPESEAVQKYEQVDRAMHDPAVSWQDAYFLCGKLSAIRKLHEITGKGLWECKELVDEFGRAMEAKE